MAATATTRSACSTTTSSRWSSNPRRWRSSICISASLRALGFDTLVHDVRFVEDNWESPDARRLGTGLGGVAQRHGSHAVHLLPAGGRSRLPAGHRRDHLRTRAPRHVPAGRREHFRHRLGRWAAGPRHLPRRVSTRTKSSSRSTTSSSPTPRCCCGTSTNTKRSSRGCIEAKLALPAYEQVMKASHTFNLLDARKAISVTERQRYILRVRTMARAVAQAYYDSREALGFPMLRRSRRSTRHERAARDFLVELGTEELPPLALPELEARLRRRHSRGARRSRRCRTANCARSPRRAGSPCWCAISPPRSRRRPSSSRARRSAPPSTRTAAPTAAATKFAEKCGVEVGALTRVTEGKGEFLYFEGSKPGQTTVSLLPAIVQRSLDAAADPEAHALGRIERRVRAAGALAGACCTAASSFRRASSTPTPAATTRGHRFMAPQELAAGATRGLRSHAARARAR